MNAADLREYARRDWAALAQHKANVWREQKSSMSAEDLLRISGELYQCARNLKPGWPTAAERDEDLAMHIRLSTLLSNAGAKRSS